MNIKRQYSLPSCNLILEGLEDSATENVDILDGQSPMSILINAECNFLSSNQQLSGGSVFLENLAKAVSNYAQGFLSGLPHPQPEATEYPQVSVTKIDNNHLHRLIVEPEPGSPEAKTAIELTTIELFDLVDAIDQFYVDRHTLPDMSLELQSVSKRHRQPEQPLVERATPAAVGIASLALAAVAFFLIPPPEIREPKPELKSAPTETIPVKPESVPPGTAPNPPRNNSEAK